MHRKNVLKTGAANDLPDNKHLRLIMNNDINNLLSASSGKDITIQEYKRGVAALLGGKPAVLAQNVGLPDPVIYRTKVATFWDKHLVEVSRLTWPNDEPGAGQAEAATKLVGLGTDPLQLTIEVCRQQGVAIVASYRMNAEDWYQNTWMLSNFGRAHPQSCIPTTGALDPADPAVFEHRREVFREVAENYDIDGIEFDYMRWMHMISDPQKNFPILTREVEETRQMLDEVALRKGKKRMLLGARVGYSLDGPAVGSSDFSCRDLGLDVKTWIDKKLVDYLCPSYFWPRLPGMPKTAEFVTLARYGRTGIYPTVFPLAQWQEDPKRTLILDSDTAAMKQLREDICHAALKGYADGADGISTFNWVHHMQPGMVKTPSREDWGLGSKKVQMAVHPKLGNRAELEKCLTFPDGDPLENCPPPKIKK